MHFKKIHTKRTTYCTTTPRRRNPLVIQKWNNCRFDNDSMILKRGSRGDSDVTFVIQGPNLDTFHHKITSKLILSIHKNFPKSQIVFSTWECENIRGLPKVDKIVFSKDPGATLFLESPPTLNNVNRQIVSTKRGLDEVNSEYAVKIRSDLLFLNNNILRSFPFLDPDGRSDEFKFLQSYVLVSNQTSVNPRKMYKYPFCICDWFWAGRTEDLLDIWSIPLMPEPWFRYFQEDDVMAKHGNPYLSRYFPESYITSTFIRKKRDLQFEDSFDCASDNINLSEDIISNNFVIKSNWQLGICSQKYRKPVRTLIPMYTFRTWRKMAEQRSIRIVDSQFDALHYLLPVIRKFTWVFKVVSKLKLISKVRK